MPPREPKITINGLELIVAEAMTVRVAIGAFVIQLQEEGLGQDVTGTVICEGYLNCCADIHKKMRIGL